MNPILLCWIFLMGIFLWFICAFLYKPIGKFFNKLFSDSKNAMFDDETKDKEEI